MVTRNNSVANILDTIILRIETELKQKSTQLYASQLKVQAVTTLNKESELLQNSLEDIICRICYDLNQELPVIYPCKCKGTMGAIHLKCLERWLEERTKNNCELCGHEFQVERTPRYKVLWSIIIWFCLHEDRHQVYVRNVRADLFRYLIITPVTIACFYICVVAADFYGMNNYENFSPVQWTTYSLLLMMALLILSYFVWVYMMLQYHQKAWFNWWQKTSKVKIIDLMPTNNEQR